MEIFWGVSLVHNPVAHKNVLLPLTLISNTLLENKIFPICAKIFFNKLLNETSYLTLLESSALII